MKASLTISGPGTKHGPLVFRGDYAEFIERASAIGFKAVELHIRDPKAVNRPAILRSLEKTGTVVSTIGTGQAYGEDRLSFTSPNEEIRRTAVQRIRDQVDFASPLGAKVILGLIRGWLPEGEAERTTARKKAMECLLECAEYAHKRETCLTLEVINRYETNFLNTAEEADLFLQGLGSDTIGLHLDTFHMNIEEVSIEEALRKSAKRLVHIHLSDSNRWVPGMGHLNFHSILSTLRDIGYEGYLGLECLPMPDAQHAAEHAFRYLEELLSKT